jgi:hypothetical protein
VASRGASVRSELDRFGDWTSRLLWPTPQNGTSGRLGAIRRAVGVVTVVGTLIQIVVWLLIAVFSGALDSPWWLFTAAGGAVAAMSLWVIDEHGFGHASTNERSK